MSFMLSSTAPSFSPLSPSFPPAAVDTIMLFQADRFVCASDTGRSVRQRQRTPASRRLLSINAEKSGDVDPLNWSRRLRQQPEQSHQDPPTHPSPTTDGDKVHESRSLLVLLRILAALVKRNTAIRLIDPQGVYSSYIREFQPGAVSSCRNSELDKHNYRGR